MTSEHGTIRLPRELDDVPGWFPVLDQLLFDWFLDRQEAAGERGDLLEVGVYMGKSAIFLGRHLQEGEAYTVCDLFESDAPDDANAAEATKSYRSTLTRRAFEANYLSFHDELPRVLQGPSSIVPGEVKPRSCRFVHIDASHLYEHVEADITAARDILLPGGLVVLDDFRSEHTPGVSIAAWEAVLNRGLNPVCLSTQKLYGTWDDPEPLQEALLGMAADRDDCHLSDQRAAGHRILRLKSKGMKAPAFPKSRHWTEPPTPAPPAPAATTPPTPARRRPPRGTARRLAVDLLPPVVTRAVRRAVRLRAARQ
ncbi:MULTISPECIES: class I SAM-dependent methyltransferase [Streptomyces]|uniref:Class I SAM-dependent methyltransferase n=1 Tax=Streptomyces caniscabiei TaxID=2746961 RepID=A0ABU4MKI9_9ACTN|nr:MULTISPECIES: class I SAM-dependent methyltransferase [Streptomyces]MBE4737198.1 class I SAM-dependent methyltransferase [Streptomyces caniscabiei]MBE4757566.1 class I SAM-dependent methyltransferase [Streptomyces caniscabiei]MBE4771042.1 class I SAM-dependent methyltransferase [Streptomyces caniscabiei]MBE4786685.1 class I SAM-dependent methyltransferase [Streptomyces caniscabiei]MBE4795061.1 class I SAM-dependent methyltransferase [Streptomyces caniscabiei]